MGFSLNTVDRQQFLCLIFQPYTQGPSHLFDEGVTTTYTKTRRLPRSTGLNTSLTLYSTLIPE
jgi:hypothetical protein